MKRSSEKKESRPKGAYILKTTKTRLENQKERRKEGAQKGRSAERKERRSKGA